MSGLSIKYLNHCLGSEKKHILEFKNTFSNIEEIRLKTGIDFIYKSKKMKMS